MPSIVGLLFALRLSTLVPPPPAHAVSFREQARLVAVESVTTRGDRLDAAYGAAVPPLASLDARALPPPDRRVRAGDLLVALARQLHVDETPLGKVVVWVATRPVQVDVTPDHVVVRATIASP